MKTVARLGLVLVGIVLCNAQSAFASNASLLVQQRDTSGPPIHMDVSGVHGDPFATFVGQNKGPMGPFLRLKMQMVNNGTTTGALANFSNSTVPVSFEIYNLSGCDMLRTASFPTSWANDGQYHDFTWTPTSTVVNPGANNCIITPSTTYHIGLMTGYSNLDLNVAADPSGTPYMINSTDPIDAPPIPAATPYPAGVVWQSAPTHADEINVIDFVGSPCCFNNTQFSNLIPLGIWDGPDFTTTASTTVHIWDRSTKASSAVFDVGLAASSGENPFVAYPTYSTNIIFGYPYNNPFIFTTAPDATTTQEQVFPTNSNITIHHGDEMWGYLVPSFAAPFYNGGDKVVVGGTGNVPQVQVCEGPCPSTSSGQATTTPTYCTPGTDPDCNSNVLFLPGFEGSRLYRPDYNGGTNQLWEPDSDTDAHDLELDVTGTSSRNDIYTKDVVDEAYLPLAGPNIYKIFLAKMNGLVSSGKIHEFEAIPYDWRLSLDDVLNYGNNIDSRLYYFGDLRATSTPYVIQELKRLAANSKTGKVTLVAHSNGGLVTKALMLRLGADASKYVDKIILVAVPQVGTPQAIAALLHGYDSSIPFKLSQKAVRSFGVNSPGAYNLLPSSNYFTYVHDAVVTIDAASLPDWTSRYGRSIGLPGPLQYFLSDNYSRVAPNDSDVIKPDQLNRDILYQAEAVHQLLDSWKPATGVQLIQIAGWGVPTTLKGIEYASTTRPVFCTGSCPSGLTMTASTTVDGDGTVVVPSALWTSTSDGAVNYWENIGDYNRRHPFLTAAGLGKGHKDILEIEDLVSFISDIVSNTVKPISSYSYISVIRPVTTDIRLSYELHSPLTLDLYDNLGHHTGVSTSTGQVEEQIPGTYYTQFGDVKYLYTNTDIPTHIVMNGYATGTFTFKVNQLQGDTLLATTTFKDIPTTPQTKVTLDTSGDIRTLSPMHIDMNGDGVTDYHLSPQSNGTVTLDTMPPEIRIGFSTSTNSLVFGATDDSGQATLIATSSYSAIKKNQSGVATTTVTAVDDSGNTTVLTFTQKYPLKDRRISIALVSLSYNTFVTKVAATLQYNWTMNTDGSYKMLASFIQTTATSTESHWRPKKNVTVIMTQPHTLNDADSDDEVDSRSVKQQLQGLSVLGLFTSRGAILTTYY